MALKQTYQWPKDDTQSKSICAQSVGNVGQHSKIPFAFSLSGEPDYFGRNEISSGGDLSHYSSASLY